MKPNSALSQNRPKNYKNGSRTIAERLSEAAGRTFVGRQDELSLLSNAITAEKLPFVVAFVHGPGGIGKSWLLRAVMDRVGPQVQRLNLDCREIEPTPQGFLGALAGSLQMEEPVPDMDAVIGRFGESGGRHVLTLDTYETFGLMDTWLRREFVPALPDSVFTIIAGREAPNPAWITTPGWQELFGEIKLSPLTDRDVQMMLASRGLTTAQIGRVKRFARGFPLALELAAAAIRTQPDLEIMRGPPPKILGHLTSVFLHGLPPETEEAVQAAACVRRVTEPLLEALLDHTDISETFSSIQSLPFIDATADGFIFQDVVRETISESLVLRDPDRYHTYRKRAYSYLTGASHRAAANTLWQYTADLLYMIENPIARNAFFPEGATDLRVEPATPGDESNIREIARAWEPPKSFRMIESWWRHHPEAFHVVKSQDGDVQAFYLFFEPTKVSRRLLETDPFTAAWLKHLVKDPVEPEERVLFCRRWLDRTSGESPAPATGACFLDVKRTYMEMRPSLRRIYCPVKDLSIFEPILFPLGFTSIGSASVSVDGICYQTIMNDFGPSSVDGWLAKILGQELGVAHGAKHGRRLVTVLFTDIVNSTQKAVTLGDGKWQTLLEEHHLIVRENLVRHKGREIDTAGDGFFAIFDQPADALRCASAVRDAVSQLGIEIRAGLHLGECEITADAVRGITVHIGARVASKAPPGDIFVSSTLKEAVAGSDTRFEDRGSHKLKGIPGEWNLFAIKM